MTLIYKADRAPPIVTQILEEAGWVEFDEQEHDPD